MERKKKEDTTYGKNESIMNKYEKELIECTENMIEISQECKDYFKEKFESDYDKLHQPDTNMDTYMGPVD